ncbi:MAG: endonuclease V [Candidatus Bathyarchaeia archaeon]|jgi:deoxyribonuclease V
MKDRMTRTRLKPVFSAKKAHEAQRRLSEHIISEDKVPQRIQLIGGVDVAYVEGASIAAVAVLDFGSLKLKESQTAVCRTRFPYVPTLLAFREIPPAILCIQKLRVQPDVLLVDGHGFAHPNRCGFASHLGLVMRKPTIGVAKEILVGEVERTKVEGDVAFISDKGEVIGAQIVSKRGLKPIYVSVGHMISLGTAIEIVKRCTLHNRLPEPVSHAHRIATAEKRKVNISTTTVTSSE